MQPSLWLQIKETVALAAELDPGERERFLDQHCQSPEARSEVASLLRALDEVGSAYEDPWGVAQEAVPAEPLDVGTRIGDYRLLRPLGEGGMGQVYLAQQEEPIERRVAIKLLRSGLGSIGVVQRFEAERQTLARMTHRNVARVFDAGRHGTRPFFVMEVIEGRPIDQFCDEERLAIDLRLRLFVDVCRGVEHAHRKGVIHRDLKPSNVLVVMEDDETVPKIIDFGIAKATHSEGGDIGLTAHGQWLGTPDYMSPEQAAGAAGAIDVRSDVYALGVLLHKLLTGFVPLDSRQLRREEGLEAWLRSLQRDDPPPPSRRVAGLPSDRRSEIAELHGTDPETLVERLQGDLDAIVGKALARDPEERYGSPAALAEDLERSLRHEPVKARPATLGYRLRKAVRRHRLAFGIAALLVLAIVGAVVGTGLGLVRARQAEQVATEEARRAQTEAATANRVKGFLRDLFEASDTEEATNPGGLTLRGVLDRGAARLDQLEDEPRVRAELAMLLGNAYNSQAIFDPALDHYRRALSIYEQLDEPLLVADAASNLGVAFNRMGRYDEAREQLGRALNLHREGLPANHIDLAETLHNLGTVEKNLELYDRALVTLEQALAIKLSVLEKDDVSVSHTHGSMGLVLHALEDYDRARIHHERSLEILEAHLAPQHPLIAYSLNNLGMTHAAQDDLVTARGLFERALAIDEATYGADHLNVGIGLFNLGYLEMEKGDCTRALGHFSRTRAILDHYFEPDHKRIQVVDGLIASLRATC